MDTQRTEEKKKRLRNFSRCNKSGQPREEETVERKVRQYSSHKI